MLIYGHKKPMMGPKLIEKCSFFEDLLQFFFVFLADDCKSL